MAKTDDDGARVDIETALENAGIEYEYVSGVGKIWTVVGHGDLTFDGLATLSAELDTRKINLSIDTGCASDPTCSRELYIELEGR